MSIKCDYEVSQTFESFGDSSRAFYDTEKQAERMANRTAELLAETFYQRQGDDAVIPHYSSAGKTGYISEIEFFTELSNDSSATEESDGRLPWQDLVARIRRSAVAINVRRKI